MKSLKPLLFICVRYSLIAGGLMVLFFVLTYYTGHHPLMIAPFLDFRIVLFGMFIFFALREFRERFNYGTLHFYQGIDRKSTRLNSSHVKSSYAVCCLKTKISTSCLE